MREQYLQTALDLTGQIETKQNELIKLAQTTLDREETVANYKAALMQQITGELGENSKPLFSNPEARASELATRLYADEHWALARQNLFSARERQSRASNEVTKLQGQVSLYKAFLNGGE